MHIALCASNTLRYPQGGHLWVFMNWALGMRAGGHDVIWMDVADPDQPEQTRSQLQNLRARLRPWGLDQRIAITTRDGGALMPDAAPDCVRVDELLASDLLLDFRYDLASAFVRRFRRSAYVDLDPGILQLNIAKGYLKPPTHDVCFTIGDSVGQPGALFPDVGRQWIYTPPCVSLEHWPVVPTPPDAPFTTVSHWYMDEWIVNLDGSYYKNDKRSGFEPFFDLPSRVRQPLELAVCLAGEQAEYDMLTGKGWRVRESHDVAPTPAAFQAYVQSSAGEFGCAKPAYVKLQSGWLSDRTVCYLASGKPCIVQDTAIRHRLSDDAGLFRFVTLDDAARALATVAADYDRHARLARQLAEEFFDARKIAAQVLNQAMER